jgi:hypothetical protein
MHFAMAHLQTGARLVVAHIWCPTTRVVRQAVSVLGRYDVLTIAKLSRWSIKLLQRHRPRRVAAATDAQRAGGGLGEYYCEHESRTRVGLCAGDTHTAAELVGFTDVQRTGGTADPAHVALGKVLPQSSALSPASARVRVSLPSATVR